MPKRARELSVRVVLSLRAEGRYAVGGVAGLYLRIEGGCRSWVLRIQRHKDRREFGLGALPDVSLADARQKAWELRRQLTAPPRAASLAVGDQASTQLPCPSARCRYGRQLAPSPVSAAETPGQSAQDLSTPATSGKGDKPVTFKSCAATYITLQQAGWKSVKHAAQWSRSLSKYAFPKIGTKHPKDISMQDVLEILQPIWAIKTETATRLRGRIESILDWAEHRKFRSGKNPAAWHGNLEFELPSPTKIKKRKKRHHPALPYLRVGAFMADLRSGQGVSRKALEWGILNASRFQEISGARHSEVNRQLRRWTIPKERMKAEKDHVVPLSEAALRLYDSLTIVPGRDLLFPAPEGGELTDSALGAVIDGMHEADRRRGGIGYLDPAQNRIATQHGFRSTFRDWGAEVAFFPKEVIEHALAHKLKDEAEAAYQRGTLLLKRAALMEQWAVFCEELDPQLPSLKDIAGQKAA